MSFRFLEAQKRYVVVREFIDYNRRLHPVDESWTFLRFSFLPYEDGLTLFISFDNKAESYIRLQWRDEEQGSIIDHFEDYVALAP